MDIIIRQATPEDAALICSIGARTFYDAFAGQNTEEDIQLYIQQQFDAEVVKNEFQQPEACFFLAYAGNDVAGYGKMRNYEHPEELKGTKYIELERIYALQAYHGKGLGQKLLQHAIDTAISKGCDLLWLGVWEHNHQARRFYEKNGFEYFGSHIFVVGKDAQTDLLMKRKLM